MKIGSIAYRMYLRKSHSNKKDVSTIYCKLIKGNKNLALSTEIKVPDGAWITKNYSVKESHALEAYMLDKKFTKTNYSPLNSPEIIIPKVFSVGNDFELDFKHLPSQLLYLVSRLF